MPQSNLDDDRTHVVHAGLLARTGRQLLVEQPLDYRLEGRVLALDGPAEPPGHLLVGLGLPNAIAAHDDVPHLYSAGFGDVRHGRDDLVVGRQLWVVLVAEVAQSPAQVQVVVDPALLVYRAARLQYPLPLTS